MRPTERSWSLERIAWLAWALVVVVITVRVVIQGDSRNSVYPVFLRAANAWLEGADAYVPEARYRYPPFATVVFAGLASIGELLGSVIWRWLNMAAYLGAISWAFRTGFPTRLPRRAQGVALLLMVVPSLTSLNNAQANGIVAGGVIASAIAIQRNRHALSALCVTTPVAFKVYPIAFAMVVAALHPLRFAVPFVLLIGASVGLPFLFQDADYVQGQYRALADLLSVEDRTADPKDAYRDLRLVLYHLGIPISNTLYTVIQALAGAGIAALCLLGRRAGWSARRTMAYALSLTLCWMLVLGFATEKSTYLLATPVLCWLIARANARRDAKWFWILIAIYAAYLLPVFAPGSIRREPLARSSLPAATFVLMLAITWRGASDLIFRRNRQSSPSG